MAEDSPDRERVLGSIRLLTAASDPLLDRVEQTLADGYACALAIESEQLKLRRMLEESAAALGTDAASAAVGEVSGLARGIVRRDGELAELREALSELAETARRLRVA